MLLTLVDTLQQKRRPIWIVLFIALTLWMLVIFSQVLQAHRPDITARIERYENTKTLLTYRSEVIDSGNIFANVDHNLDAFEISFLRNTVSFTDWIARSEQATRVAIKAVLQALVRAFIALIRFVVMVIITLVRAIIAILAFTWRVITFPFIAVGKGTAYVFRSVSNATNSGFASVIQPQQDTKIPVITPEQAHQVLIIQENTLEVEPIKPAGSGGACDNGSGNGGYPMEWCDARMDTIRTVAYSNDRINRQCTSYAYWYFSEVLGNKDFRVSGNANRWARTSNYPVHASPVVGAIAVETRGYYGHVAIVQALPGQTYEGKVVPDGYVLVSEMNYDWQGHFRYSYSPLSKFSAYIHP